MGDDNDSDDDNSNMILVILHGIGMIIAFGMCYPIGAYFSMSRPLVDGPGKSDWFKKHKYVQVVGIFLTTVCFFLIVAYMSGDDDAFQDVHHILGLVLFIVCLLQGLLAFFRPHAPESMRESPTSLRMYWVFTHRLFAAFIVLGGILNMILGLQYVSRKMPLLVVFGVCGIVFAIATLLLGFKKRTTQRNELFKALNMVENDFNGIETQTIEQT